MEKYSSFLEVMPIIENWLRTTVRDEMQRTLEADRQKAKPEKMLSRDEVCKLLGISLPTLWAKTKSGQLRSVHVGRRILYPESELKRFIGR